MKDIQIKKQSLKKDTAYVYAGYMLRYLGLIILIPYYSRVLGPESYGQVLAAMSLMSIIWLFVSFGFSHVGARELAATQDQKSINEIFTRQILGRSLLTPVGLLLGLLAIAFSPIFQDAFLLGFLAVILGLLKAFNLGWFFQGMRLFRRSIFVEALAYPINLGLALVLVKTPEDSIYALLSVSIATLASAFVGYTFAFRNASFCKQTAADVISEIKISSTLFILNVNTALMAAGSTYLLSLLSTADQVGYFGAAERIIAVSIAFLEPASRVLMPTIANRAKNEPENVARLVKKGITLELGYGFVVMTGGLLLGSFVLPFFLGQNFVPSVLPFQILVCLLPFAAFKHAFGFYVLIPQKKEKWLFYAYIAGNIINVAAAVWVGSLYGAIGMAIARVIGEAVTALFLLIIAFRENLLDDAFKRQQSV